MPVNQPTLRDLAYEYFHQDWDIEAAHPDGILTSFVRDEGTPRSQELEAEISDLLACRLSEQELEQYWLYELRSQFEPGKFGMTYRRWFEHLREVLRASVGGA